MSARRASDRDVCRSTYETRDRKRSQSDDDVRQSRALGEPGPFKADDILVQGGCTVILGERSYRLRRTGKSVETMLTVTGGRVSRFRLLEDRLAISRASR